MLLFIKINLLNRLNSVIYIHYLVSKRVIRVLNLLPFIVLLSCFILANQSKYFYLYNLFLLTL